MYIGFASRNIGFEHTDCDRVKLNQCYLSVLPEGSRKINTVGSSRIISKKYTYPVKASGHARTTNHHGGDLQGFMLE